VEEWEACMVVLEAVQVTLELSWAGLGIQDKTDVVR
jgi:hypothetical protein